MTHYGKKRGTLRGEHNSLTGEKGGKACHIVELLGEGEVTKHCRVLSISTRKYFQAVIWSEGCREKKNTMEKGVETRRDNNSQESQHEENHRKSKNAKPVWPKQFTSYD